MLIIDKYITQSMPASASGLLATLCPPVVQAAEKPRGLPAAGLSGDVMGSGFLAQSATGLLVVLVSVIVVTWMIKRFGRLQSSAKGTLRMIDGMALSTRERIVLVQVGDTQVLLGVAPGRVEAVHVLEKPVVTETAREITGSFATRLREALVKEQQQ